jgi:predicted methyltransferase
VSGRDRGLAARVAAGRAVRADARGVARRWLCALAGALLVAGCATRGDPPTLGRERIAAIVASPERSEADRTNDRRRKPEDMLGFIGIRPGITALDVSAGGGYTTELLARAIGPSGRVYGQSPNPRTPGLLAQRAQRTTGAAPIVAVTQPFEDPVPAALADGGLDLVTLMFNYHDFGHLGVDRARANAALYRALRHGGVYVVADHAGRPGTGIAESGTLHRVEEALVRSEVEAAGFRLVATGDFLRNPNDPRDRTEPDPPQPKDEFVLKFVKP